MIIKKKSSKVIWFTGLSGSGKSTLSNQIYESLKKKGFKVKKIDGDIFRKKKKTSNSFTKKNIISNNLNIINEVRKIKYKYNYVLVSVISPFLLTRKFAKKIFKKDYIEINIFCTIKTLIKRDTKGLYKKALNKQIKNLIGFKSKIKYQKSNYKVLKINTDKLSVYMSSLKILKYLKNKKQN